MLNVKNLAVPGVAPVSLRLERGVCATVQAASGTGKTLLLRALGDLDPVPGEVRLDEVPRERISGPRWRRRVRYFAAEPGFWARLVGDHFADQSVAAALLGQLGLGRAALDWEIDRLSTGERHRVALARGLEDNPAVLLLDEPTAALDRAATGKAEALISSRLAAGACAVLVTHDGAQARRMGARHFTISRGALIERTP